MREFFIEEITLSNFRKFTDKTFELNRAMNVFIGKNGSGKTAVLEAINVMLGAFLAAFKEYVPSRYVFNLSESDVHLRAGEIDKKYATAPDAPQYPCSVSCKMQWGLHDKEDVSIEYSRILEKAGGRTKFDGSNSMQKDVVQWEALTKRSAGENKEVKANNLRKSRLPVAAVSSSIIADCGL